MFDLAWAVAPWTIEQLIAVLIAVFGVYGVFILKNTKFRWTVQQRLMGTSDDDTDEGFLAETEQWRTEVSETLDDHAERTSTGLEELQTEIIHLESKVERVEQKVDTVTDVVEDRHDVKFRGNGGQELSSTGAGTGSDRDADPDSHHGSLRD